MGDKQRQEQQRSAGRNMLPFAIPGPLSPFFDIMPSSPQDAVAFAEVWLDSFVTDSRNTFWWSTDHNIMVDWIGRRMVRKMRDSEVRHFKVIETTTGGVVAFARWTLPKDGHGVYGEWIAPHEPEDELAEDPDAPAPGIAPTVKTAAGPLVCPTGADPTACRIFFDALSRASNKWVTPTTLVLAVLCTSPKYFGRGAARSLLQPMLDIADTQDQQVYLEATPAGKPLYEKLGFRQVDTLEFDLNKLTPHMTGVYILSVMIRPCRSNQCI